MSVTGLISGFKSSRENSSSTSKTIHHNNPLFKSKDRTSSPIKKHMTFPRPGSPIMKKNRRISKSQEESSQTRSPLSPKDVNQMTPRVNSQTPIHDDTPRPIKSDFHQNLNEKLRSRPRRPQSIHQATSPLRVSAIKATRHRKRPSSCYSPSSRQANTIAQAFNSQPIEMPRCLPPPPKIPNGEITFPLPADIPHALPKAQKMKSMKSKLASTDSGMSSLVEFASIEETVAKIKRKATRQMDLAVYQAIQLFCSSPIHRSNKILDCLLHLEPKQLVKHFLANLGETRSIDDRRNAADTLSSLVLYGEESQILYREHRALLDVLSTSSNLSILTKQMKDDDIAIRSYITGVLANLHIEPSLYLGDANPETSDTPSGSYSFSGVTKIIRMLSERNPESKEAALTAIICLGPIAAAAVEDLGDFLMKEKNSQLRVLACHALNEIGSPYALQAVSCIQEILRKDKEESVKQAAQQVLDHLRTSSNSEGSNEIASNVDAKFIIDESMVRKSISECQAALKGVPVNVGDLKQYFLHCYPTINTANPKWRHQLRDTLHAMVSKGMVTKTPATFTLA